MNISKEADLARRHESTRDRELRRNRADLSKVCKEEGEAAKRVAKNPDVETEAVD